MVFALFQGEESQRRVMSVKNSFQPPTDHYVLARNKTTMVVVKVMVAMVIMVVDTSKGGVVVQFVIDRDKL